MMFYNRISRKIMLTIGILSAIIMTIKGSSGTECVYGASYPANFCQFRNEIARLLLHIFAIGVSFFI